MSNEEAARVIKDLQRLQATGKLDVLAAVAGIPKARLKAIAAGVVPTAMEVSIISMLR